MKLLDFISELVGSLAWPITAIIIAFVYKKPILGLLNKIKNLSIGNFEAEFKEKIDDITNTIKPYKSDESNSLKFNFIKEIEEISKISPEAAISLAWSKIEYSIKAKAKELDLFSIENEFTISAIRIAELLLKNGKIEESKNRAIFNMAQLRNNVVHFKNSNLIISKDSACEYGKNAEILINYINKIK